MMYEGLPKLPGNTFTDPTKTKFHIAQSLGYKNGYALAKRPTCQVGGEAITTTALNEQDLDELANFKPTLTYGQAKQAPPEDFIPAHVAFDKKVLKFDAYFKQTVHESNKEFYRVRRVIIHYYLEDDSISVLEPHVTNCGIPQGMLIKRQRLPKNDQGDHWHWKNLNLGMDVTFYGKTFHICDLDLFTKNFLESEGIVVNPSDNCAIDPYIAKRQNDEALKTYITPSSFDKLKQFIELDRKVLRFLCVWDDRHAMFGELLPLILHYYLVDDTLELREVRMANDGHDPFPMLIGRHKVPRNRDDIESSFPLISMELTNHEIKDYFTPKDFMVGKTVHMYGRRVLLYDCDNFTKAFYYHNFGITDFTPVEVKVKEVDLAKMEIPPYNNLGSLEDSMQSCISVIPKPPKKDYVKMMENHHRVLRFEAELDSVRPEDKGRRFIISYQLSDDMVKIYEPHGRNTGIIGGKFLEGTRVAKPGCNPNKPDYYGPADFYIGSMVTIFAHRFVITNADEYVLKYMKEHSAQFPESTITTLDEKIRTNVKPGAPVKAGPMTVKREPGDLDTLVQQVSTQLKKMAITDRIRIDEMFLKYNRNHTGFVGPEDIKFMCKKLQLPVDEDVIMGLVAKVSTGNPEQITLEDFREFLEN